MTGNSPVSSNVRVAAQAILDHAQPANYASDYVMVHRSMIGTLRDALASPAETGRDAEDAAKWRALRNCARITAMGSAGLERETAADYAHVTLNFWTCTDNTYGGDPGPPWARDWLDRFVEKARRAQKSEPRRLTESEIADAASLAQARADGTAERAVDDLLGILDKLSVPPGTPALTEPPTTGSPGGTDSRDRCDKHGVELAFEGDECWECTREKHA